jgi:membrane peptidoglycan carboxypeptidase
VYATFARGGVYKDVNGILSVKDSHGREIFKRKQKDLEGEQVLSPEVSYLITNMLADNNARMPAFGVNNYLWLPNKTIAVKTGTTDMKRDNYTFGYTPSYVVSVWVGNNDNKPMNKYLASGLSGLPQFGIRS